MQGGPSGAAPDFSLELDLGREKDGPQGLKRPTQSGSASHQPCHPLPPSDGALGAVPGQIMGSSPLSPAATGQRGALGTSSTSHHESWTHAGTLQPSA